LSDEYRKAKRAMLHKLGISQQIWDDIFAQFLCCLEKGKFDKKWVTPSKRERATEKQKEQENQSKRRVRNLSLCRYEQGFSRRLG